MKKQKTTIKVGDLKARKDIKGGVSSKPNKLQPTGGSKPSGGGNSLNKINL